MIAFAVRAIRQSTSASVTPLFTVIDTEDEAKSHAEKRLKEGCTDVSVWRLVACPTLKQTVSWS